MNIVFALNNYGKTKKNEFIVIKENNFKYGMH